MGRVWAPGSKTLMGLLIASSSFGAGESMDPEAVEAAVAQAQAHIQQCEALFEQPPGKYRSGCIRECTRVLDRADQVRQPHLDHHRDQFASSVRKCSQRFENAMAQLEPDDLPPGLARMNQRELDRAASEAQTYLKNCDFYAGSAGPGRPSSCHQACQVYLDGVSAIREARVTAASTTEGLQRARAQCRERYEAAIAEYRNRPRSDRSPPAVAQNGSGPRPTPTRCERRLTGKLCVEAEARAARATRALLGNLGVGQGSDAIVRQGDQAEAADKDATGVLRPSGGSTVYGCNKSDQRKRVASLRWSCVPSAVINQEGYQCDLHFSGWAEFEENQCKALRFSGPSLMLAVYKQNNDERWEPVIYSYEDSDLVDFDSAVRQPVPSLRPVLQSVCGYVDRNFYLTRIEHIHPKPRCADGRDPIILNLSVRAPDKSSSRARFDVGF